MSMSIERARDLVYERVGDPCKIVAEIKGVYGYAAVTANTLYYGTHGRGKDTLKVFPLDTISTINTEIARDILSMIVVTTGPPPVHHDVFSAIFGVAFAQPMGYPAISFDKGQAKEVEAFVACVMEQRAQLLSRRTEQSDSSIPDQIRQLAKLRDEGILSEGEFQAKKNELLSRL